MDSHTETLVCFCQRRGRVSLKKFVVHSIAGTGAKGFSLVCHGRWFGSTATSASVSRSTELPIEILEEILLHLPGQDVVKM